MYIPKEMKLNRFKEVSLPSARDFFRTNGEHAMPDNMYTGDELAPVAQNKTESIQDFIDYAEQMEREQSSKVE